MNIQSLKPSAKIRLLYFTLLFLLFGVLQIHAEESRWAVLVGIDQYQRSDITPLSGAVADARAIANVLSRYCNFPEDQVFLLTSDDPANRPDLGSITIKFDYVASKVRPGDTFLFYFAGHGESLNGRSYIHPWDADRRSEMLIKRKSFPVDELSDYLSKIRASKVLIIMDACRSNPEKRRGETGKPLTEDFARGIRVEPAPSIADGISFSATIFSCKVGASAYEWPGKRRGFFSVALEEAFAGKAASEDGRVNLDRLESYLHQRVPELVKQNLGQRTTQVPWVERLGAGAGDFVWSRFEVLSIVQFDISGRYESSILIRCNVPDALARVDDKVSCNTNQEGLAFIKSVSPGHHKIEVSKQGYVDYSEYIIVKDRLTKIIEVSLIRR